MRSLLARTSFINVFFVSVFAVKGNAGDMSRPSVVEGKI